jgi:hypothetical protein
MSTMTRRGVLMPSLYRPAAVPPMSATDGETKTELYFTAVVEVNGKQVPIDSGDLLKLAEEGIEFALPPETRLELGTLKDLVGWFAAQMSFTAPNWDDLPDALKAIIDVSATIDTLYIKASKTVLNFDLGVTLTFDWTLIGSLKLKTFSFELKRLQPEAA